MQIKLFDEQTKTNGIVYSRECLEGIVEQLKDTELLGEFGQDDLRPQQHTVDIMNACVHYKNFRLSEVGLEADVKFVGEKKELLESGLIDYEFGIRAITKGNSLLVEDFQVITFDIIEKGK